MVKVLKAAPVVNKLKSSLRQEIQQLKDRSIIPSLKVILVGKHKPSLIYTANKKKLVESLGGQCEIIHLDEFISESDFLKKMSDVTNDPLVHGTFVQLPVPPQLQHLDIGTLIPANKDIDGFHADNLYKVLLGSQNDSSLVPCTPKGVITLLEHYQIPLDGKKVVIIGRSMIVGKPMGLLALSHNATITYCHSKTPDVKEYTSQADIIISAVGSPRFINKSYLRAAGDQVLIDVGINHDQDGVLCGDFDFENVKDHCQAITPVPGGVGPMTIISLAQNLISATRNQQ